MTREAETRQRLLKARKLFEAIAEPCEPKGDADHSWRRCRHCLAIQELDHKGARELIRDFLSGVDAQAAQIQQLEGIISDAIRNLHGIGEYADHKLAEELAARLRALRECVRRDLDDQGIAYGGSELEALLVDPALAPHQEK